MMRRNVTCATVALLVGALAHPAHAGPADTPLPAFSDGKAAVKVYTAVGVIKNNNLETAFFCTNLDSASQDIGVEVFDETGARRNAINAGNNGAVLNVGPGQTKTVSTSPTAVLHEDASITLDLGTGNATNNLRNGSGRVVATSKNISCTAILVDKLHSICDPAAPCNNPPPTIASLPLIPVP
jgi:hypothetical protein